MSRHCHTLVTLAALVAVLAVPATAPAEDWASRHATGALIEGLQARQMDAVAAGDPDTSDRFIAALLLPGQLLVVSATHPAVDLLAERLRRGEHRNLYMDLQATARQDTKFFVHDMNADGLDIAGRGEAFDIVYQDDQRLVFDGQWEATKLEEDEYWKRIHVADTRYARMLGVLTATSDAEESSR